MKTRRFEMRMDPRRYRRVIHAVDAEQRATGKRVTATGWIEMAIDMRLGPEVGLGEAASARVGRSPIARAVSPGEPAARPPAAVPRATPERPPVDRARLASLKWNLEER